MLLARVCYLGCSPMGPSILRSPVIPKSLLPRAQGVRLYSSQGGTNFIRTARNRTTLKERLMAPAKGTSFTVGKACLLGGSAIGLGSLCYYGLGLSSEAGTIDYMFIWPKYVKDRIRTTYMYLGLSALCTAGAATLCLRTPVIRNLAMQNSWMAFVGLSVALVASGTIARNIPYEPGFGKKQVAWLAHIGVLGLLLTPLSMFGGPAIIRAAWSTVGIAGGLSLLAICAPSEKFLYTGGPLAVGLGLVFASTLAACFLPPTTAIGSLVHATYYYGGLTLFSLLLLYDTQNLVKHAERIPYEGYRGNGVARNFDPINHATSMYMDLIHIFTRLLQGSGQKKI